MVSSELRPAILLLQAGGQLADHSVAVEHLRDRAVRLASLADRGHELAVLQLDAVVRYRDARKVDRLFLARDEVVVARDVGAGVADVAEEGAERAVVVERQAERADRAGLALELDRHVHRDAELGMPG